MLLSQADVGQNIRILRITDEETALQALRIGLEAGECVTCVAKIPTGPIVIRRGGMEVALGRQICVGIEVEQVAG